ncbi:MAG: hypothetical protein ACLTYY_07880 [Faecalibacterium prausnitzii]
MQIISLCNRCAGAAGKRHHSGNGLFDGIHIGHRAVIESAVQWAKEHDAAPAVFTFAAGGE